MNLPDFIDGCLFRLDEASGTTVTDSLGGMTGTVANPDWTARGALTLAANTTITMPGDAISPLMRLDTLENGSVMVMVDVNHKTGTPSDTSYLWSYGDISDAVNGAYIAQLATTLVSGVLVAQKGGSTWQQIGGNSMALLRTDAQSWNSYGYVFHAVDGKLYHDGYYNGFHSRSSRMFAAEGSYRPGAVPDATGLRIGARANGSGSASIVGAVLTNPAIRNFCVLRIQGDWRHRIPGWMRNIDRQLRIGGTPRLFRGITE